jgi:hypothetical protein
VSLTVQDSEVERKQEKNEDDERRPQPHSGQLQVRQAVPIQT